MSTEQPETLEGQVQEAALLPVEARPLAPGTWGTGGGIGWLAEYERMSMAVARAIVLPPGIRRAGDPSTPEGRQAIAATALAVALAGREYGLGFMAATRLIHVIDGQTAPAAQLMVGRARTGGHSIVPVRRSLRYCRVTCSTCELPEEQQVEWALNSEDATSHDAIIASEILIETWEGRGDMRKKTVAPLTSKSNWHYVAQMLFWRASTDLIRMHCPEATMGMYALEELGGDADA